ncbi:DUF4238 domain-containing protein [Chloroflexota bacterium]
MANRRQHTIPQFYLKKFLSPGWVYRHGAEKPRLHKSPTNVAVHQDYYGRNKAVMKPLDDLNKYIEDKGAPSFTKLIKDIGSITDYDWHVLSFVFGNIFVRTPAHIEEWRDAVLKGTDEINAKAGGMIDRLISASLDDSDLSEFRSETNDESSATLKQLNEYAAKLKAIGGHRVAALDLFSTLPDIAECIRQMTFIIWKAPNNHFYLTSDRPLVVQSRKTGSRAHAGWAKPDALGTIAVSPSHFLTMFYYKLSGIYLLEATQEQVAGLNLETIRFAKNEVYSTFEYPEANDWMKAVGRCHPKE